MNGKNPAAVALGRLGGRKGGQARALALTPQRRSDIASHAARKRWKLKRMLALAIEINRLRVLVEDGEAAKAQLPQIEAEFEALIPDEDEPAATTHDCANAEEGGT